MPSPGELTGWHTPDGPGIRVDTGFEAGRTVQPYYDSLLAKLMVWGRDREQALARAGRALAEFEIEGVKTTLGLHRRLLNWEALRRAEVDTEALERELEQVPSTS
jgi:acetyl-CoA carboxylase biotin carboxylase subunit